MTLPALFDRLRLPVIASPLFIISNPEPVIAQCRAGVAGSFPALVERLGREYAAARDRLGVAV